MRQMGRAKGVHDRRAGAVTLKYYYRWIEDADNGAAAAAANLAFGHSLVTADIK
jgi:hypothetical protein